MVAAKDFPGCATVNRFSHCLDNFPGPGSYRKEQKESGELKPVTARADNESRTSQRATPQRLKGKVAGLDAEQIETALDAFRENLESLREQNKQKVQALADFAQKGGNSGKEEGRMAYSGMSFSLTW